jgi:hypothetical protein
VIDDQNFPYIQPRVQPRCDGQSACCRWGGDSNGLGVHESRILPRRAPFVPCPGARQRLRMGSPRRVATRRASSADARALRTNQPSVKGSNPRLFRSLKPLSPSALQSSSEDATAALERVEDLTAPLDVSGSSRAGACLCTLHRLSLGPVQQTRVSPIKYPVVITGGCYHHP